MKKTRVKRKTKSKAKSQNDASLNQVTINGRLDNLLDHVKQLLYKGGLTFEDLLEQVKNKLVNQERDKLEQDLKRCLGNNLSFYLKDGLWQVDKTGNPANNHFYQWLSTMGYPVTFRELLFLAEENGLETKGRQEQDLVYDGRFIRLRSGKWGLSHWQVMGEPTAGELTKIIRLLQKKQRPLTLAEIMGELFPARVVETGWENFLRKDERFLEVAPGRWFLKSALEAMKAHLAAEDVFAFIRQAEISVLQEAELVLIIKEADSSRRQYILSSLDLERGILRLNKRMMRIFGPLEPVAYLDLETPQGPLGVWYLQEHQCLAGLGSWYEANKLEPGSKLEICRSGEKGSLQLKASGEREAEVFAEGLKIKKLEALRKKCVYAALPLEEILTEILQLYPQGLDFDTLLALVGIINSHGYQELQETLHQYPYFEELQNGIWRCNQAMRQTYQSWHQQVLAAADSLELARRQAAAAMEEIEALHDLKQNLEEELAYLQNHHREEEALFQEKISSLAVQNEHLSLENSRLRSDCLRLEEKQKELLEDLEHQSQQLLSLRGERNKLKVKLEQAEVRAMQLQSSLNKIMEDAREEIRRLTREVQEKTHQIESLQYANQELQKNLARLHEERREIKRQVSSWPVRLAMFLAGLLGRKKSQSMGRGLEG
ncbi:MAG: hypothetical protein GX779_02430 [Clostridia bacterium]|nr:hypothetical protein [Clostridia bacterium]